MARTFVAFLRRADEGTLSRLLVSRASCLRPRVAILPACSRMPLPSTKWILTPSPPRYGRSLPRRKKRRSRHNPQRKPRRKRHSSIHRRAAFAALHFSPTKKRRENPCWFLPATLIPPRFRPSLAGCAAGVKFLLPHLSLYRSERSEGWSIASRP